MAQIVNAYGKQLRFPDDMSREDMHSAIRKYEHQINPDYVEPNPSLKDRAHNFARDSLGVDPDNIPEGTLSNIGGAVLDTVTGKGVRDAVNPEQLSIGEQAELADEDAANEAAPQIPGAPVRRKTFEKAVDLELSGRGVEPREGVEQRIQQAAETDVDSKNKRATVARSAEAGIRETDRENIKSRGADEFVKDLSLSATQGGAMAVQGFAWLSGLAGLDTEGLQNSASDIVAGLEERKSDQAKVLSEYVQSQEGFKDTFSAAASNPAFIADIVAQSAVLMLPGAALAATAAKAGKIGLATQAGQKFIAEAGARAAIQAGARASAPVTAAAIRTAQLSAKQKVLVALATGGAIAGEGLTSGGIIGADVSEFVKDISFDNLAVNSERFRELVSSGMGMGKARDALAKELSEPAALRAGTWTSLVSGVTGAGKFLGEIATGAGVTSLKQAVKNTAKETLDETLQEPGDEFFGYQAKVQVDPNQELDLGQAAALGAVAGAGQASVLNVVGAATAKAADINERRIVDGLQDIGKAQNVDEVIAAASETVANDPVTVDQVLDDAGITVAPDPTLADVANADKVAGIDNAASEDVVSTSTIFTDEGKERFPEGTPEGKEVTDTPQEDESRAKFSKGTKPNGLYSRLEQVVGNAPPKVFGKASQVKLWIQSNAAKNGVKKDETYWTGINEWLDTQDKVSKEDVSNFLKGNGVQVEDVVLKELKEGAVDSKYALPSVVEALRLSHGTGAPDLDAAVLTLENDRDAYQALDRAFPGFVEEENWAEVVVNDMLGAKEGRTKHGGKELTLPGGKDYKEVVLTAPSVEGFKEDDETHFGDVGQGKQIAWMRNNVRKTGNGDTLFLEEIQSQRAQEGRKKGFDISPSRRETLDKRRQELEAEGGSLRNQGKEIPVSIKDEWAQVMNELQPERVKTPPAPFVSDSSNKATNAYISLVLKKAILQAVADGQNSVTWTTGDQQADRYDLSKSLSRVTASKIAGGRNDGKYLLTAYNPGGAQVIESPYSAEELPNVIGKELADKILSDLSDKPAYKPSGLKNEVDYSGLDLKVGGGWTQSMYGDKTGLDTKGSPSLITQAANTILKQTGGGKVESISVGKLGPQPGFVISDKMRATVTGEGLPLFSKGVKRGSLETSGKRTANIDKGLSQSDAVARTKKLLGNKTTEALIDSGVVNFIESEKAIPTIPGIKNWEDIEGRPTFGVTVDGRMFLVRENLSSKNFDGVLKHEGFHATVRNLLGKQTYDNLLKTLAERAKLNESNPWITEAYSKVPASTDPRDIWEEVAAYAIEGYTNQQKQPNFIKRWVESFLSAIRTALIESKKTPESVKLWVMKNVKPQDLANLAVAGLRAKANSTSNASGTKFSKDSDQKLPAIKKDIPKETKTQKAQRAVQGRFNRFKVIREWLGKQGINISEQADVYAAEERFHSKFANQVDDFREEVRNPLIEKITDAGFSISDVADYLEAQHAAEANAQVQKVRGDPEATAYGITDEEAQTYLDKAKPELKKLANEVRAITSKTKKLLLDNGIINKDITEAWDSAYKFYVPVKGGPDESAAQTPGKSKGLKTKRTLKRRLGHGKRDEKVVENIFSDFERAVMTVELNRVGKHLVMMAAEIGRDDLVTIGQPEKRGVIKTDKAFGVYNGDELLGTFEKESLAKSFAKDRETAHGKVAPLNLTVSPIFDSRVAYSASPMLADNELNVYIEGHAIRVQIVDELLARAYGNLGSEALGYVLSAGRAINAYLSKVYTGYSPEFIVTNIIRDFTTGIINITGEEGIQLAANAVGRYPKAFASLLVYASTRKATPSIKAYRDNGGNTGAAYLSDLERLGKEVETEVDAYRGVTANLKDKNMMGAARAAGRKAFNATLKWIEALNQAGENAMRLAVFEAALENGKTPNKAASLAKNSTVNFNRKGEVGAEVNAAYLFFNAAVQGVAATAHAMTKGKNKYQAWGLTGGLASLGYLIAAGMGGGDEDEYDKLSDYTKERNMVIKAGDGWVKIPVPYGYGFFWNFGRIMADAQRKNEWDKATWRMSATAVEELTPFGSVVAGDSADSKQLLYALPTVAQMIGAPIANLSGMGGPVMPDNPFDRTQPDRERMWRGTQGTPFDVTAGWLEAMGLDVSPETLRHYTRSLGGGAGDIVATSIGAANLAKEGASLETHEVPFVRKGFTKLRIGDTRRAYYDALQEASAAQDELNRARRDRDISRMRDIRREKKELLAMYRYSTKLSKVLSHKRDVQDALKADKTLSVKDKRARLKTMEQEEAKIYDRFLQRFK